MIKISASELARLAELSGLSLNEAEATKMTSELEQVLSYVEQLNEVNTDKVEPTYQVLPLENVWREDEVKVGVEPGALLGLKEAEKVRNQQIKVPRVL